MRQIPKVLSVLVTAALVVLSVSCGKEKELPVGNVSRVATAKDSILGDSFPGVPRIYSGIAMVRPAKEWRAPVGVKPGVGYFKARGIIPREHYGEDWNGNGGGNTDLGDLVYAAGDGVVFYARDFRPGWGTVVRMIHNVGTPEKPEYVESLYAHLSTCWVDPGNFMKKGEPIGTIGTADGIYHAHLHFEIRTEPGMPIPWTEGGDVKKYVSPTEFIEKHQGKKK